MIPRWKQQLGGLFIAVLGAGFTVWGWYTALTKGYYYVMASMIFPAFFVIGLGLVIFPGYREERVARGEDISKLAGAHLITFRWWVILAVALAAGGANSWLLS